jgi:hypothetical protein
MRSTLFSHAALLGAALSLLPGCHGHTASGPSPSTPMTQPDAQGSWRGARVGDRVTYAFTLNTGGGRLGGPVQSVAGRLTLEVVAVQQPWVWLRAAYSDEAGRPLPQPRLAQELLVPVRTDGTRTLEVSREGQSSAERPSLAGRTWEATQYVNDARPADGPLQKRVYANTPGPLYLTEGLLEATTTLSGFGAAGGSQLTLVEHRQGTGEASAAPPSLERPLGPGAYYDRRVDVGGEPSVQRTCFAAERGFVLRTDRPATGGSTPCGDFSEAEPQPLAEVLLALVWEAVSSTEGAPATAPRGTSEVGGRSVPTLTAERTEEVDGTRRVHTSTWAADPWSPALAGLPVEARFQPLAEQSARVETGGQRQPEGGTRLVQWGVWLPGASR